MLPGPPKTALAREAAAASFVLLTNKSSQGVATLPLTANPGRVLLTGPFVDEGEALFGTWTLDGRDEDAASPAVAIRDRLQDNAIVDDGRFSDRTLHLVRQADVTVALVGEHPSRSGEANSVTDLPAYPQVGRGPARDSRHRQATRRSSCSPAALWTWARFWISPTLS